MPYDTRNVLRRVLKAYEARGLTPIIAPEIEFYLLTAPKRGDQALEPGSGVDGRDEFGGEAFSFDALDRYAPFVTFLQGPQRQRSSVLVPSFMRWARVRWRSTWTMGQRSRLPINWC